MKTDSYLTFDTFDELRTPYGGCREVHSRYRKPFHLPLIHFYCVPPLNDEVN